MKQVLITSTVLFLAVVIGLTVSTSDGLLLAFASNDIGMQIVRGMIIVLLVGILATTPPRSFYVRSILAISAILLSVGSVVLMLNYAMLPLDAILFFVSALVLMVEAIEVPTLVAQQAASKKGTSTKTRKFTPQTA